MVALLQQESAEETRDIPSWIQKNEHEHREVKKDVRSEQCKFFDHAGFVHISSFCSRQETESMKHRMKELVDKEWDPNANMESFGTDNKQNTARGDYFLESSNKIHYFAEPCAMTQDGSLKQEYLKDKIGALNKVGHAMHIQPGPFRDYCLSPKIRDLVLDLGWKHPVVPQSMYIFKQARIGGAVHSHQDSTFLFTTPKQSCLGLWLALDDATLDNGCLWVRPKSHRESVRRQYKRNPAHFGDESIQERRNDALGDTGSPKFVMETLCSDTQSVPWDGSLPLSGSVTDLLNAGFIPIECKAGDLLAFCGELDHLSLPNTSGTARHTFQLHLVEGEDASITWSTSNWLQYPSGEEFISLV